MIYIIALIIPLLSWILQSYPRLFNKYFGVDVWTRFIETDLVRKNGHRIPNQIKKRFIIKGHFDYPPLFPLLLSFIPKKTLENLQGFISPFFDALHCFVIFIIAYQITNRADIAIIAQLIYASIPLIALENSYLTPRSFGYLNLTLALYPLLLYSSSPKLIYLAAGYFFATLIFLTHRFATQSFLFAVIFFSFLDRTLFYAAVFLTAFLSALIVTRGYYLKVLQGHWLNIYFWIINYKNRWVHQVTKKSQAEGKRDFVGTMLILLGRFVPITLIGLNPWLVSSFLFIILNALSIQPEITNNSLLSRFTAWVFFFYIFAIIIVSVKRLLPIGEGQRYIEMAAAPSAILSSILFFTFFDSLYQIAAIIGLTGILMINFTIILFAQTKIVISDRTRSMTTDMRNAFVYINKMRGKPRIICIPHQITTMTLYNSKAEVLVNANNLGLLKMLDFFPVLKKPITKLADQFDLDYLLLRQSYAKLSELKLKKENIVYKSGDVLLVKL